MAILEDICHFFSKDTNNSIEFWECPSRLGWHLHKTVDLEMRAFNPSSTYPYKMSWDYSKKTESDGILNVWKMMFQASDRKGKQFLNLLNNNSDNIELSYIKEGPWLQAFGQSNSLCVCATRAITNHAPISEYRLRFFPREEFKCSCSVYLIESRRHILYECTRFNSYWNLRRNSLSHFVMFLKTNPNAFTFLSNSHTTSISRFYS